MCYTFAAKRIKKVYKKPPPRRRQVYKKRISNRRSADGNSEVQMITMKIFSIQNSTTAFEEEDIETTQIFSKQCIDEDCKARVLK